MRYCLLSHQRRILIKNKLVLEPPKSLDRLEDIRQGLLVGAISKPRLEELAGTIKETRESALDPVMSDILDEIELRAKIELAKLEDG